MATARKKKTETAEPDLSNAVEVDPAAHDIVAVYHRDTGAAWFTTAENAERLIAAGTHDKTAT